MHTPKTKETLDFIKFFFKKKGYMPSLKEIGERFDISIVSSFERLDRLEKKGFIKRSWGQKRYIEII